MLYNLFSHWLIDYKATLQFIPKPGGKINQICFEWQKELSDNFMSIKLCINFYDAVMFMLHPHKKKHLLHVYFLTNMKRNLQPEQKAINKGHIICQGIHLHSCLHNNKLINLNIAT